jgi:hypothetical protein
MNKKERVNWRLCDEFHAASGSLTLACFSSFLSFALSSGGRSTSICASSCSCGGSASADWGCRNRSRTCACCGSSARSSILSTTGSRSSACGWSRRSRSNRGSLDRWGSGTGERFSVCDLVGVASDVDGLEVTRESRIWRGLDDGCASIRSNSSAESGTCTDNTSGDSHVGVDRWQDLGAADHVDVVDQTLLGWALEGHDLKVIDNRLEAAVGKSLVSDRYVGIVANDLVENSLMSELIDLGVVTDVSSVPELGGVGGKTLAGVLEVGHHTGVEGPVVSRCLESRYLLLRDGLCSRS